MSIFVKQSEMTVDHLDWGTIGWRARPANTGSRRSSSWTSRSSPASGTTSTSIPQQDELITVMAGQIEQWIERGQAILEVGDSVYLDTDVVHASFNVGGVTARLLVMLAPGIGDEGYQLVDVSSDSRGPRRAEDDRGAAPHRSSRLRRGRPGEQAGGVRSRDPAGADVIEVDVRHTARRRSWSPTTIAATPRCAAAHRRARAGGASTRRPQPRPQGRAASRARLIAACARRG